MQPVQYFHFGVQCPYHTYMQEQTRQLANALQREWSVVDLQQRPDEGKRLGLFFPGTVVIDDCQLVYPAPAQFWLESYRRRGPLPGEYNCPVVPQLNPDRILPFTDECGPALSRLCLKEGEASKAEWLRKTYTPKKRHPALVARCGEQVVAAVECLPETMVPYAIPYPRYDYAWLLCLYGDKRYRNALLQRLTLYAAALGYRAVRAAVGCNTPFPNGPWPLFQAQGFVIERELGPFFIRHRWDDLYLVSKALKPWAGEVSRALFTAPRP